MWHCTVAETDMVWPRFLFLIFSSGVLELGITLSHWEILLTHSIIRKIHYPQWANKSRDLEYLSTNRCKCDWLRQGGITGCVPITLCCQMRMPLAFVMGYGLHSPDSAWCLTCHNTWQTNENPHNKTLLGRCLLIQGWITNMKILIQSSALHTSSSPPSCIS